MISEVTSDKLQPKRTKVEHSMTWLRRRGAALIRARSVIMLVWGLAIRPLQMWWCLYLCLTLPLL